MDEGVLRQHLVRIVRTDARTPGAADDAVVVGLDGDVVSLPGQLSDVAVTDALSRVSAMMALHLLVPGFLERPVCIPTATSSGWRM